MPDGAGDGLDELREQLFESKAEVECADRRSSSHEPLGSVNVEDAVRRERGQSSSALARWSLRWAYHVGVGCVLGVALPALLYTLASEGAAGRDYLLPVSIFFVSCAVPIAVWGIVTHVNNYWQPTLQKYVIRILWMVPVYSVTSLSELCLWLQAEHGNHSAKRWTVIPSALRDCYEAYTVLNFFYFCLAFLEVSNGEAAATVVSRIGRQRGSEEDDDGGGVRHPCPPYSCMCAPWQLETGEFLDRCQYGILLYVTLMPLCAIALIVDAFVDHSSTDASSNASTDVSSHAAKSEIEALATPVALTAAIQFFVANHTIYCLGLFYFVTRHLLAPCRPHLKFVAVKGLVFATFFQNIGIDAVFFAKPSMARAFSDGDKAQADYALGSVQATLMCVEMLGFALLHASAFPVTEFPRVRLDPETDQPDAVADTSREWLAAWGDYFAEQKRDRRSGNAQRGAVSTSRVLFDVSDVHADTTATIRGLAGEVTGPLLRESQQSSSILAGLLRRWRADHAPPSIAIARLAARTTGAPSLI